MWGGDLANLKQFPMSFIGYRKNWSDADFDWRKARKAISPFTRFRQFVDADDEAKPDDR
jgi:hypothetical protein